MFTLSLRNILSEEEREEGSFFLVCRGCDLHSQWWGEGGRGRKGEQQTRQQKKCGAGEKVWSRDIGFHIKMQEKHTLSGALCPMFLLPFLREYVTLCTFYARKATGIAAIISGLASHLPPCKAQKIKFCMLFLFLLRPKVAKVEPLILFCFDESFLLCRAPAAE